VVDILYHLNNHIVFQVNQVCLFHIVKSCDGTPNRPQASKKQKPLQIIFPKPVRRLRANPEYIDRARIKSEALAGNLTGKHVAGSPGGAAATVAVPNAMRLRGWGDVMGSGAVGISGGIAVKQMGRGDSDSGLPLDESDFNLVDNYNTFLIILVFLFKYKK
jgi:hypothetical protein